VYLKKDFNQTQNKKTSLNKNIHVISQEKNIHVIFYGINIKTHYICKVICLSKLIFYYALCNYCIFWYIWMEKNDYLKSSHFISPYTTNPDRWDEFHHITIGEFLLTFTIFRALFKISYSQEKSGKN
jgi:hypothetical protein